MKYGEPLSDNAFSSILRLYCKDPALLAVFLLPLLEMQVRLFAHTVPVETLASSFSRCWRFMSGAAPSDCVLILYLYRIHALLLRPVASDCLHIPYLLPQVDPNNAVRKTIALMCEKIVAAHPEYTTPCVGAIRTFLKAGRCRLTVSKPVLTSPVVSAL